MNLYTAEKKYAEGPTKLIEIEGFFRLYVNVPRMFLEHRYETAALLKIRRYRQTHQLSFVG